MLLLFSHKLSHTIFLYQHNLTIFFHLELQYVSYVMNLLPAFNKHKMFSGLKSYIA
jgi:hypothetical protein